jgi:hypothetical protein
MPPGATRVTSSARALYEWHRVRTTTADESKDFIARLHSLIGRLWHNSASRPVVRFHHDGTKRTKVHENVYGFFGFFVTVVAS